jgi:hypothetical protein
MKILCIEVNQECNCPPLRLSSNAPTAFAFAALASQSKKVSYIALSAIVKCWFSVPISVSFFGAIFRNFNVILS